MAVLVFFFAPEASGQTIYTTFGKNRVQYHNDFRDWWAYETDNYTVLWYGKIRNIARTAVLLSQISYDDIEDLAGYKMNRKIRVIIYSNLSDFYQSNLGIKEMDEFREAGTTRLYDNKVLVYFNGNHNDLLHQIREGTARVFMENMFRDISYENVYNNVVKSGFPDWFNLGTIAYLTHNWDLKDDETLRHLFMTKSGRKMEFKNLDRRIPKLAGKSFYHFFEQKYGLNRLSDFFYFVRISGDINASLESSTNIKPETLFAEWKKFFKTRYEIDREQFGEMDIIVSPEVYIKNDFEFTSLATYDEGLKLCYTSNNSGKIEVFLDNDGIRRRILKMGYINTSQETDYSYPLAFFNKDGSTLGLIYEKKNTLILRSVNTETYEFDEHLISPEYRKIYSGFFYGNEAIVLNADTDGFPDLYIYDLVKRQSVRLTEDFWDDLDAQPAVLNGRNGIVFASNRGDDTRTKAVMDTIPPLGNFDIFFFDHADKTIKPLTAEPKHDKRNPIIQNNYLYFITDESGVPNIKARDLSGNDPDFFITNSESGVISFAMDREIFYYTTVKLCDYFIKKGNTGAGSYERIPVTYFRSFTDSDTALLSRDAKPEYSSELIEIEPGLLFQSGFSQPKESDLIILPGSDIPAYLPEKEFSFKPFLSYRAFASRLRFSFSEIITRVDNEALFEGMESFSADQNSFVPPPPGFLIKSTAKDMLEDHFVEAGLRIATNLGQLEYFWVYENLKRRIDWQFAFYRKTRSVYDINRVTIIDKTNMSTNLAQVQAKYSFDTFRALKLISRIQLDRSTIAASDPVSLNQSDITGQRISLRAEYVFDNTSKISTNLFEGNRSKVFIEAFNRFSINLMELKNLSFYEGIMTVAGFDTRQYFRFWNNSVAAIRLAGQTSFGSERNLYFLGGMENWYFSSNSDLVSPPAAGNYAYKILVANMRGFGYNARNGTSFLVFNSELRFPVFRYFFGQSVRSALLRDFQLTLFYDMGLAWEGFSPFSEENRGNFQSIEVPPSIKLKIRYYSDPMVAGFGIGARTNLFGYFVKFDYAWGIDTRVIQKPMPYLSVGFDF